MERKEEIEKGLKGNEETEKGLKGNEETEKGLKDTSSSNFIPVERNKETEKGLKGIEETDKGLNATSSSNLIPVERNEETKKGLKATSSSNLIPVENNEETEKGLKATSSSNLILVQRNKEIEKGLKATSFSNSFPVERNEEIEKGLKATSSSNFDEIPSNKGKEAAKFAQLWNRIISSFREEDLITNWIPAALHMANESKGREKKLKTRLKRDHYMSYAVCECYASCKNIMNSLVLGICEKKIINEIFLKVDNHIEKEDLTKELNMSSLPGLYEQFIMLIEYLVRNKKEDKDQVVIVLLNMLEIVTRDILEEEVSSLEELNHRGYRGTFAPFSNLGFPVKAETEAWKEKSSLKNINNRYRDDRENSEYFESRDKIVEGDEPTTETRVLKVMNQQPRFSMAMNQRSRVLKAMNQQLRQEAVTTATTNN
uniref:Callose synthase helical domain-containing protein n=1 Tax=Fagus sylvatica TaxID=28930 RepID=A0A2N9EE93_FAGSY